MPSPTFERSAPLNAAQCRAARALLGWSSHQLARAANLETSVVRHFEDGALKLPVSALFDLSHALEAAGVEFLAGRSADFGVRIRRPLQRLAA